MRRLPALLLAISLPLVPWLQARVDGRLGPFRAQEQVLYLWSGGQVKRLCPGFATLAADLYWLRTVQYFGGQRVYSQEKRFELLAPLIDLTTTLDPRLEIAYRYGAIFLSEGRPLGAGQPEQGIALLGRGAPHVREGWRLRQMEGYFTFLFLKDPRRAAQILMEASQMPGAAYWLKTLAAGILLEGGERAMSREMWAHMLEQSEGGVLQDNARFHLRLLDALDTVDALNRLVAELEGRTGRRPATLEELRAAGLLATVPVDPMGVPFAYDAARGRVTISRRSPLWRAALES